MKHRPLGKTGIKVSAIALGTVALGVDYGISAPGEFGIPAEAESIRLLQEAADAGVNLFDTAPNYGESERLIGRALGSRHDCYVATKVYIPRDADGQPAHGALLKRSVEESLANSLRALRRESLDIVQIHNATPEVVTRGETAEVLLAARREGKIRFLGASVYGEEAALSVLEAGCFDVLQVAYNLLDQRMSLAVFPAAERNGVGVIVRSAMLKGALTPKARWLPSELVELRVASEKVKRTLEVSWRSLPQAALRFCLSDERVGTVLVGARTIEELRPSLKAEVAGPLSAEMLSRAHALGINDERLLNPSYWPIA